MIKIEYTGMCKYCTCSDLELDYYVEERYQASKKYWSVKCIHADACSRMEDKTLERLKLEDKDNGRPD